MTSTPYECANDFANEVGSRAGYSLICLGLVHTRSGTGIHTCTPIELITATFLFASSAHSNTQAHTHTHAQTHTHPDIAAGTAFGSYAYANGFCVFACVVCV